MNREQRIQILELVKAGYDVAAAAAKLDVPMSAIRKSKTFGGQVDEAFATATSRLRGRLLESALADGDVRAIAALLEKREQAQAATGGNNAIDRIEWLVLPGRCVNCGELAGLKSGKPATKLGNGAAT